MAIIEVSEDGVRRAVGDQVFGQAKEWVGKVSELEAGGPVISATVDGVPVSVRILPD
jgi:predicted RNA-binding protein